MTDASNASVAFSILGQECLPAGKRHDMHIYAKIL